MPWYWLLIVAAVRLLFLLAPFMVVHKHFALNNLVEAKEFAKAGACKAALVSYPALLFVAIMAVADKTCTRGVSSTFVTVYVFAGALLSFGFYKFPEWWYRGTWVPFYWIGGITLIDILATVFFTPRAVAFICVT